MPAPPCPGPLRRREFLRLGHARPRRPGPGRPARRPGRRGPGRPRTPRSSSSGCGAGPASSRRTTPSPTPPPSIRGPFRPDPDRRAGHGHLRAVPAPGQARRQDRPGPVAAPHDVVAQRRLDRGADRQDARPGPTRPRRPCPSTPTSAWSPAGCAGCGPTACRRTSASRRQPFMTRPTYLGLGH